MFQPLHPVRVKIACQSAPVGALLTLLVLFVQPALSAPGTNGGRGGGSGVEGAALVTAWNNLVLDWVRQSERGPTISGRFAAYVNVALFDSWAAFSDQTTGAIVNLDHVRLTGVDPKLVPALRDYAMSVATHRVIDTIGETVLRQRYLEPGTGEFAEERLVALRLRADQLLESTEYSSLRRLGRNRSAREWLAVADALALRVADTILAHAESDQSNQQNDYADTTGFQVNSWVYPQPSPGTSDFDFLDGSYYFPQFDPVLAATVGNEGFAQVHPLVLTGEVRLTTTWQSLTQMGVFPPADDGGEQFPLTPHWGRVSAFTLNAGNELRPPAVLSPYDERGRLSEDWLLEARQLVEFAGQMQDGVPGSALQRARSEYWELGDATEYPPGWWLQRATDLADERGLSQREALKLTLGVSLAVFDSGVASWDTKYFFDTPRPITAINEMFFGSVVSDWRGNQTALTDDRDHWRPYQLRRNLTPPFPDIVSGHSSFSTSAATVMRKLTGSNVFDFTTPLFSSRFDLTDGFDGDPANGNESAYLHWPVLTLAAEEAGLSRLYGGIHMMEGNLQGLVMGTRIGHRAVRLVSSLFGDQVEALPVTVFGSGRPDPALRTPAGACGLVEIYGFHDPDRLVAAQACRGSAELFGGQGRDTFRVEGLGNVLIRDFEAGEYIEVSPARVVGKKRGKSGGQWLDGYLIEVRPGATTGGYPVTRLIINGTDVLGIEGTWTLAELELSVR